MRANEETAEDAADLVALAVGGAYLQVIAAKARLDASRAQLEIAEALYRQALEQRQAGVIAQTDLNRAQIQAFTGRQRMVTLQNDLAKQKIDLARLTGLPPNEYYETTDLVPFSPAPPMGLVEALRYAMEYRSDLRAAEAQVRAAEKTLSAARAERIPSFSIYADYGVLGKNPSRQGCPSGFCASAALNDLNPIKRDVNPYRKIATQKPDGHPRDNRTARSPWSGR